MEVDSSPSIFHKDRLGSSFLTDESTSFPLLVSGQWSRPVTPQAHALNVCMHILNSMANTDTRAIPTVHFVYMFYS